MAGSEAEVGGGAGRSDIPIAERWLTWRAACHGHSAEYLTETFSVPADVAEQLIALANPDLGRPAEP